MALAIQQRPPRALAFVRELIELDAGPVQAGSDQATTALVRLLGAAEGDPRGDADLAGSPGGGAVSLVAKAERLGADAADPLRGEAMLRAVAGVMQRRLPQFELGEEPFLQLEVLRAMRLQLLPPPPASEALAWWAEQRIGPDEHAALRRQLVDVVLRSLRIVADGQLSRRPQAVALGCLRSLAACSASCRTNALRAGAAALAVEALQAQTRAPGPPAEAALVLGCEALVALTAGSRSNARAVAEAGADAQALELMRRFGQHREVASAAFSLLGAVARDEAAGARLAAAGPEALAAARAVLERWPEEVRGAAASGRSRAPAPELLAALQAPPPSAERGDGRAGRTGGTGDGGVPSRGVGTSAGRSALESR
ncbi:unnamed protein product [Prorocentrum cordatum]|uniref:Uncharacterized protein n=1 Tax=Prorocentrum cordatum TaxID=2364126 RepID=A0ABN9PM57_9DINO|nr:unnamed protein product [Polarella glacialis]